MVRFALVALLVGCVGSASHAPAWPKQHEPETDGGESLAPRVAAAAVMAAASTDVEKPAVPVVVAPAAVATTVTPAVTPVAAAPATDETLQTEEIIIEIDE